MTVRPVAIKRGGSSGGQQTSFSKTQLFSFISGARHSNRRWLLFSRHSKWALNWSRQLVLISWILRNSQPVAHITQKTAHNPRDRQTYTLAAQRVTFLPSFKHSISPFPFASALHFM
jgi:hypothetical protein